MAITYQDELSLESDLIQYLQRLNGSDQWQYRQDIKTTQGLWQNFKQILEVRNVKVLGRPLSDYEFQQVQNRIMNLSTPYLAGKFLYGTNGVVQIDITLDDGHVVYLNVLDTSNIGAGSTIYQVVNQIERPSTDGLRKKRRFDTTLLINGLPVIQIEEKPDVNVSNTLNNVGPISVLFGDKQYTGTSYRSVFVQIVSDIVVSDKMDNLTSLINISEPNSTQIIGTSERILPKGTKLTKPIASSNYHVYVNFSKNDLHKRISKLSELTQQQVIFERW